MENDSRSTGSFVSPGSDNLRFLTPAQRQLHGEFLEAVEKVRYDLVRTIVLVRQVADHRIHRLLGFSTIAAYAEHYARFTESQTREFMKLGGRLIEMNQVTAALGSGTLSWSKAREICRHATSEDQEYWIEAARILSCRQLHDLLARPRIEGSDPTPAATKDMIHAQAGPPGRDDPAASEFPNMAVPARTTALVPKPVHAPDRLQPEHQSPRMPQPDQAPYPPVARAACHVPLRFTPEQYARWESLAANCREVAPGATREELVITALQALSGNSGPAGQAGPHHLIVILRCPDCASAQIVTSRGEAPAPRALLETAVCDGEIEDTTGRRRRTVAPRLRRLALQRARYRCEAQGCRHALYLEIHHRVPVEAGGTDDLDNVMVLCSRCHRALHEAERDAVKAVAETAKIARAFSNSRQRS